MSPAARRAYASLCLISALALPAAPAEAQWTADPAANTPVATGAGAQVLPKLAAASDGGHYVGWFDNASGAWVLRLSRLDADGVPQWGPSGLLVSAHPQSLFLVDWDLLCDAADHAVLVFTDTRAGPDRDVVAYRIAPDGTFVWGADGLVLSANADDEPSPKAVQAEGGDLVFVWTRLTPGGGTLRMQRVTPQGAPQLAAGGLAVVAPFGETPAECDVVAAGPGAVIVSWVRDISAVFSSRHVRARKFDLDGAPLWPAPTSVYDAASLPNGYVPGLLADGAGGALLWWHVVGGNGLTAARVQRLDAQGAELFPHDGVKVSTDATSSQVDPALVFDAASGEASVFWIRRNAALTQWGLRGQRLSPAGAALWGPTGVELLPMTSTFLSAPSAVADGAGAQVHLAFDPLGTFADLRLRALGVDAAGATAWSTLPSTVLSGKTRLSAAADCTGGAVLLWEDDRGGTQDVYAQRVSVGGGLGGGAAWTDLGLALSGSAGPPRLDASGTLCPGDPVTLHLADALAGTQTTLVIGLAPLNAPFKGGTLVPQPLLLVPGLPTGASGSVTLSATWPPGLPSGVSIYLQHWILDPAGPSGLAASNGVRGTQP